MNVHIGVLPEAMSKTDGTQWQMPGLTHVAFSVSGTDVPRMLMLPEEPDPKCSRYTLGQL